MPSPVITWFLTKKFHSLSSLSHLFIMSRPLAERSHTLKVVHLQFRLVNWSWLWSLGLNLTLTQALWHSQNHTWPIIPHLDFLQWQHCDHPIFRIPDFTRCAQKCVHYFVTPLKVHLGSMVLTMSYFPKFIEEKNHLEGLLKNTHFLS